MEVAAGTHFLPRRMQPFEQRRPSGKESTDRSDGTDRSGNYAVWDACDPDKWLEREAPPSARGPRRSSFSVEPSVLPKPHFDAMSLELRDADPSLTKASASVERRSSCLKIRSTSNYKEDRTTSHKDDSRAADDTNAYRDKPGKTRRESMTRRVFPGLSR